MPASARAKPFSLSWEACPSSPSAAASRGVMRRCHDQPRAGHMVSIATRAAPGTTTVGGLSVGATPASPVFATDDDPTDARGRFDTAPFERQLPARCAARAAANARAVGRQALQAGGEPKCLCGGAKLPRSGQTPASAAGKTPVGATASDPRPPPAAATPAYKIGR